jgi:hypothetical protein
MQPYLFPYVGYFQLIQAVDKFVVYDDVNFIKGGWINRNKVLINQNSTLFTVPLDKASSFSLINEIKINLKFYGNWKIKFLRSLKQSYGKAPFFNEAYALVDSVLDIQDSGLISELSVKSIKTVSEYLHIPTKIIETSEIYNNNKLGGEDRVVTICGIEKASKYINLIGGLDLYNEESFKAHDIELAFIKSKPINYKQSTNEFVTSLSIIDVLMNNSPEEIDAMLHEYELI